MSNIVSLHPYFKIKEGGAVALKALCPELVQMCDAEDKCLYYAFSFAGDSMFCREAYEGAQGVFEHMDNVGEMLGKVFECADLEKLEIHGPAAELAKLKEPLQDLNPTYYEIEFGI